MEYCCSGVKNFDELLGGGFPKPASILIAGSAGAGKTTLVIESLSWAAEHGEKAVYIPITTHSKEKIMAYLHSYPFFSNKVKVHPVDRSTAEKDPLTTLLDIGNILTSLQPDRLVINPITSLGFGFPEQERHRFFYSFEDMLQNKSILTFMTGELNREQIHDSVITHISDGVIYLDRASIGNRLVRNIEITKLRGAGDNFNNISTRCEFRIGPEGIEIFPRLKSESYFVPLKPHRLSTGVSGLDIMMHGGIPENSAVLLVGGPGLGKTLFGLQFIVEGLKNGEPGIIVIFEKREEQLIYEASRLGWDLKSFVSRGLLRIIYSHQNETSPDEHNIKIKSYVDEIGAKRLFFDGAENLEPMMPDPSGLKNHIQLLTNFLKSRGVTAIFTYVLPDLLFPDKISGRDILSIADVIIRLRFMDEQKRIYRAASILKLSGSGHDQSTRKYILSDNGIEIVQKLLPL